ncbi:MAG TPA: hypothetical protein VF865_02960 [Acidobacteriaceae bacterium]
MPWLKSIAREVLGLFVDDGSFALAILACVSLAIFVLPRVAATAPPSTWTGPALFAGLAIVLIQSALRFARRRK